MGKIKTAGYQRLEATIEAFGGENDFLDDIAMRLSIGEPPKEISRVYSIPWFVVKEWVEDDAERIRRIESGKKAFADQLTYDALEYALSGDSETARSDRIKVDTCFRMAGFMNPSAYGKSDNSVSVVNNVQGAVAIPNSSNLMEYVQKKLGVTLNNGSSTNEDIEHGKGTRIGSKSIGEVSESRVLPERLEGYKGLDREL